MQTGSRLSSEAAVVASQADGLEVLPEPSYLSRHPVRAAGVAAVAGGWLGMTVSVLVWFDEPLRVWFEISKVATTVGTCSGLGLVALVAAVKAHRGEPDDPRSDRLGSAPPGRQLTTRPLTAADYNRLKAAR